MSTDKKEVSTEKGESSNDQKEVPMEKGESSTDQKEVSTEKEGESSTDQKYNNWIPTATRMVKLIYNYSDKHFPPTIEEKISDMKQRIGPYIDLLNEIPEEKRQSGNERLMFEYSKGKLYNAVPGVYKEEAELHLRKAIDLDPSLLDAWISLSNCLAKKGDYQGAKNYFQTALKMNENSTILRQLAEIELVCALGSKDPPCHIDQCIEYAQKALTLDNTDGCCFYILGSAYNTSFLLDGGWNHNQLLLSLEAYEKAEGTAAMKSYPNLQYDCGIVNRFLENYDRSLICLSNVVIRNPANDASLQVKLMLQLLDKLEGLLQGKSNDKSKGKSKEKSTEERKIKSTETSLSSVIQSLATIEFIGAVRCLVKCDYKAPVYYVLCDSDEKNFVLTVFGIQKEAIKQGDHVTILEPFCKFVNFEWERKHYKFKSVRVNLLEQVLVNGKAVSPDFALRESIL